MESYSIWPPEIGQSSQDSSSDACILQCVFQYSLDPQEATFKKAPDVCGDNGDGTTRIPLISGWVQHSPGANRRTLQSISHAEPEKKNPTHNQQNKAQSRTPGDSYCRGRPALARDGWRASSARRPRGAPGPRQQASKPQPAEGSVSRIAKAFCSESSPSPQQTGQRHCCPSLFSPSNSPNRSHRKGRIHLKPWRNWFWGYRARTLQCECRGMVCRKTLEKREKKQY